MFSVERKRIFAIDTTDNLNRFVERFLPDRNRWKLESELGKFRFVPTDADAQNDSSVADPVEIGSQSREHHWMPVQNAIDDRSEPNSRGRCRDSRQMYPRFR